MEWLSLTPLGAAIRSRRVAPTQGDRPAASTAQAADRRRAAAWRSFALPLALSPVLTACVVVPPPAVRTPVARSAPAGMPAGMPAVGPSVTPVAARPAPALASRALYFYPEQGQDATRQDRDRYECYRWAVQATGEEPGMTPTTLPAPAVAGPPLPPVRDREADGAPVVAGAAVGAMAGAVMSGPRSGPAPVIFGALLGATLGAAQRDAQIQADARQRERAAQRAAERADQVALIAREQALERARAGVASDDFRRAMSACMEGRHYTVR